MSNIVKAFWASLLSPHVRFEDGGIKDRRNIGNTAYFYAMSRKGKGKGKGKDKM
jgi:hypothetical protein